jgi:hypothetical protein
VDGSAFSTEASVLVYGTYLIRSAKIQGHTLQLRGDLNTTDAIEVFAPAAVMDFTFNDQKLSLRNTSYGSWSGKVLFKEPAITLPSLKDLEWVGDISRFQTAANKTRNTPIPYPKSPRIMMTPNGPWQTRRQQPTHVN